MAARPPEILAPAGTLEAFAAALASGADAVYLGLSEGFNARARSTDFSLELLPELVQRAHRAGARLYLTLNTLVFESELPELERVLRGVIASGVDALIVQDPATALLARRLCPQLHLHASTQMTISSAQGALFAATLGVRRVVLPRELSTDEIARFVRETSLEAEVFVHGALCMAWSGQCLTSEAFSERSANRGQCSQACRMPYEAIVDGKKRELGDLRYLLSPGDLAAHEVLPELVAAGVHSLKIEGRYKGPVYVSLAVDSWRNWRQAVMRGPSAEDRRRLASDVERTRLSFSRGGGVGFLRGDNHQTLVEGSTPKHRGVAVGSVQSVSAGSVVVRLLRNPHLAQLLRPGVGVKFELTGRTDREHDPDNAPGGALFNVQLSKDGHAELAFGHPGPDLARVHPGDWVRLTADPELNREVEQRLQRPITGRVGLSVTVSGKLGTPLRVRARARNGSVALRAYAQSESSLQPARSDTSLERTLLQDKLGAFGNTPFELRDLDLGGLEPGLHLPVSELKSIRRELSRQLESALNEVRYPAPPPAPCLPELSAELASALSEDVGPAALVPLCRTEEQLEALIEAGFAGDGAGAAEVELDWMEMVGLGRAVRRAREAGLKVTLATVRVQKPGEEAYDRRISALEPDAVLVRHWGALMHFSKLQQAHGGVGALAVHGDFSLNVTNSLTAHHLLGLGLSTVTASHDLNRAQLLALLERVPRGRVAVTLHHHIATFHNSHCVYAHLLSDGADYKSCGRPCEKHRIALRDYAGNEHPLLVDVGCRNTLFNASAQSAAPLVPRLLELGVRRFRVEFVWETGAVVQRILTAYRALLSAQLSARAALEAVGVTEGYGATKLVRLSNRGSGAESRGSSTTGIR
jgi:putative protease